MDTRLIILILVIVVGGYLVFFLKPIPVAKVLMDVPPH